MSESRADRGSRRAATLLLRVGAETRTARHVAGLTLERVAQVVGISASELSRIERGIAPWVDLDTLGRISTVVGLDLWVRLYPGAEPLRDAAHLALLDGFRSLLGPGLRIRAEVPIGDPRDLRAWDVVVVEDAGRRCGVELDTRLVDAQAQLRRVMIKRRDGDVDRVLMVIADTRANRLALRLAESLFVSDLSVDGDEIRSALADGRIPPRDGVLMVPFPARAKLGAARASRATATGARERPKLHTRCRPAAIVD